MNYLYFLLTLLLHSVQGIDLPHSDHLVIDKPAHRLYVLGSKSDTITSFDCALGRNYGKKTQRGDCKTPDGEWKILTIEDSSNWEGDASGSDYGPWFMRLGNNSQWHSIGIHGTNKPKTVGTRASLGCIRLHNGDLQLLKRMVSPGCKVTILSDTITTDKVFNVSLPGAKRDKTALSNKTKSRYWVGNRSHSAKRKSKGTRHRHKRG